MKQSSCFVLHKGNNSSSYKNLKCCHMDTEEFEAFTDFVLQLSKVLRVSVLTTLEYLVSHHRLLYMPRKKMSEVLL